MKFDQLYKQVFVKEPQQSLSEANGKEIANPDDFDDVEPAPLPEVVPTSSSEETAGMSPEQPATTVSATETASSLHDYIQQLEEFAAKLNEPEGNSLQTLISSLDQPQTPFEGISSRTRSDILKAAETLRTISEQLKSYLISAAATSK